MSHSIQIPHLDTMHLHVGGYCLLLDFSHIQEIKIKKPFIQMIFHSYTSFLSGFCRNKNDYIIYFKDSLDVNLYRTKDDYYIHTFNIKSRYIEVFHHISISQFQLLLKILIQKLLLKDEGFYFHASSVIYNEKLLIFTGPSTAGKSTVATKLQDVFSPFSDDTIIIKKVNNSWKAFQLPLDGVPHLNQNNQSFPISTIFILKKSKKLITKQSSVQKHMNLLMNQIIGGTVYKKHVESLLSFINTDEKIYELYFPLEITGEDLKKRLR